MLTGGAGFVGGHLAELLVSKGHKVRILDDLSSGRLENLDEVRSHIEFIKGSILDTELISEASKGADGIFHLAAIVSVPLSIEQPVHCHSVNLTGTLNILEAARTCGASVVFSSSAAVYGDVEQVPVSEATLAVPISPYGVQKLAGEHYLASYSKLFGIRARALRYFNIYGPRQDPSSPYSGVITAFAKRAASGETLTINGDGSITRDFVFVEDVARANLLAMGTSGPPVNIGTGQEVTLAELAHSITKLSGKKSEILHGPERPGDILRSCADIRLAKEELNFEAKIQLQSGLASTLDSMK